MRIEPPPSLPCATGTMAAATAAAAPPLEPPTERSSARGFKVAPPLRRASVDGPMHSSDTVVRAKGTSPEASKRSASVASNGYDTSSNRCDPRLEGKRRLGSPESFSRNGMPRKIPRWRHSAARALRISGCT